MNKIDRIEWISNIRALSIVMVIFLHCASPLFYSYGVIKTSYWNITNFYDSLVRSAVPLFFMVSGSLVLGKDKKILQFIKSFWFRLVIPFLFYSIIYSVVNKTSLINIFDPGKISYHFYFVPIIFTLYICYPIISKWIKQSSNLEIIIFLALWICSAIVPSIYNFQFIKLGNISFFGGFIGYTILGYLIGNRSYLNTILSKRLILITSIIFYWLGFVITFFMTYLIVQESGVYNEKFYGYLTPNVLMMAIGIFLFLKEKNFIFKNNILISIRNFLSDHSYGIFFLHPLVLGKLYFIHQKGSPLYTDLIIFLTGVTITVLTVFIMSKIPLLKKVIG